MAIIISYALNFKKTSRYPSDIISCYINRNKQVLGTCYQKKKLNDGLNSNSRSRILLVDDDVGITSALKIGLEDNGFVVDAFNDPLLALSNFKAGVYDLLLFDIRMPQLGGFDLYDKIKKEKNNNQDLKVCYITAYDINYEELRKQFPDLHINCFIKKPIQISDLIKRANTELGL